MSPVYLSSLFSAEYSVLVHNAVLLGSHKPPRDRVVKSSPGALIDLLLPPISKQHTTTADFSFGR